MVRCYLLIFVFVCIEFESLEVAKSEEELTKFVFSNTNFSQSINWVGIVFLNTENVGTKPSKLNYKIRDTDLWHTDELFQDSDEPGPSYLGKIMKENSSYLALAALIPLRKC